MRVVNIASDGGIEFIDSTVLDGVIKSFTNVVTGTPSVRTQQIILGGTAFAGGVLASALYFSKNKKKHKWYAALEARNAEQAI